MPKDRFTSLDVRRSVVDLRKKLIGLRLANLYDIDRKTYLLKFAKPDYKAYLVVESGFRIHTTQYTRDKGDIPNVFAVKLRKHIRTKRLDDIQQFGMDRVIDFTFGTGTSAYHLIIELYSGGNIILTDNNFKILILLRSYQQDDLIVSVGATYSTSSHQELQNINEEFITEILKTGNQDKNIKNVFSEKIVAFGGPLIEHTILEADLKPSMKVSELDLQHIPALVASFQKSLNYIQSENSFQGYIICKKKPQPKEAKKEKAEIINTEKKEEELFYDSYLPFLFRQFRSETFKEFPTFDDAVDEYYSKIYSQKVVVEQMKKEGMVDDKLEKVKADQEKRMAGLDSQVQKWERCAALIEQNIEAVDQCINAIRISLSQKIGWSQLNDYIKEERAQGNTLAAMIHKLKLEENHISILLYDKFLDEEEQTSPAQAIDIDIGLSAHANATSYYTRKKKAEEKKEKTLVSADQAYKSAEKKAQREMKDVKVRSSVKQIRKPYWFEKFMWFISSDNFVVVGGRDIQQNELIYKRYLEKNDLYFHADIHGASSVILKNPKGGEVPPLTITQAGTFATCHSNAWKDKVVTSAYWVNENQVSKTAPSGEYLTTGSFIIRGKKNFLPHSNLVMGLGVLFSLAEESIPAHANERKPKFFNEQDQESEPKPPFKWEPKHKNKPKVTSKPEDESDDDAEEEGVVPSDVNTEENPAEENPAEENPTDENPTYENPTDENPTDENPTDENPTDENLTDENPTDENPTDENLTDENPAEENSAEENSAEENPAEEEEESESSEIGEIDQDLASYSVKLVRDSGTIGQPEVGKKEEEINLNIKKKKISAKERRQLKKQKQLKIEKSLNEEEMENPEIENPEKENPEKENPEKENPEKENPKIENPEKKPKQKPIQYKKGQKAKMKKMKEKYGWQDEEDRKISMQLLGHGENQKKNKKAQIREERQQAQEKRDIIKTKIKKKAQQEKEDDEIRLLLKEEKVELLTEEDKKKIEEQTAKGLGVSLSSLTGRPLPSDVLLYCIPMCAPYDTLRDYKYKIKIIPGSEKKGKALKSCIDFFIRTEGATERERELIKAVPETEWNLALISNCKVSAPGINPNIGKKKKK